MPALSSRNSALAPRGHHRPAPAASPVTTAWMDALWELHCGTPLANAVRYTDSIVEAMWDVFQPLLSQLDVFPLSMPEATPESVTTNTALTTPFTDFVVLSLVDTTPQPQRANTHRHHASHGIEATEGNDPLGNTLTPVMRAALIDQPKIVLALIEFFTSVWLYQYEVRCRGTHADLPVNHHTAVPAASTATSPPLRRLYAAVSGDLKQVTPFDHLGAAQLGRLLTVKGTVVRMSPTRISCVRMAYRCGHCGVVKEQTTEDGVLSYPGPCASAKCRGYKWVPLTEQAVCEEVQLLRLQEHTTFFDASPSQGSNGSQGSNASHSNNANGTAGGGGGGMHVMIEVELRPPWLDAVTVGDGVCVCGILETRRNEGKQGGGMQQVCLRARAVRNLRSQSGSGGGTAASGDSLGVAALQQRSNQTGHLPSTAAKGGMGAGAGGVGDPWRLSRHRSGDLSLGFGVISSDALIGPRALSEEAEESAVGGPTGGPVPPAAVVAALPTFGFDNGSAEETGRFYEMARHPHWFERLTASVAPSIFGMELVKQALLLAIVGGNRDKNGGETRSSIHVLLVGDPGLGKSQLLRAACGIAPRSAFVCTHTSSSCGLTMTLTRDPVSGETTFEAGAVVHGDGGITCLDEIDKGVQEHKALLEVMEQETVSLAKAGMIFSMPVHTSVLAAGNPIGGRFDVSKSLAANVNLSPALMSRFDIIACLRNPHGTSGAAQQALTDHVLRWHRRGTHSGHHEAAGREGENDGGSGRASPHSHHPAHRTRSPDPPSAVGTRAAGPLPISLVQRFLLFCRSQCQPTLCPEACDVLQAHYLAQRQHLPEPQFSFPVRGESVGGNGGYQATSNVRDSAYAYPAGPSTTTAPAASSSTNAAFGLEGTVTPRYLQALIRVSEARAKLELRHDVTRDDAEYAVQILQSCLHSFDGLAAPNSAGVGLGRAGGSGMNSEKKSGKLNQRDAVLQRLKQCIVENNGGVNLFTEQAILDVCEEVGCRSAAAMLRQLNEFGFLLQRSGSTYCLRGC